MLDYPIVLEIFCGLRPPRALSHFSYHLFHLRLNFLFTPPLLIYFLALVLDKSGGNLGCNMASPLTARWLDGRNGCGLVCHLWD
jgi:hypothetical protein